MQLLYNKLIEYCESDYYPFHMPGHKRNMNGSFKNPFDFDITEIDGFDNLNHCEGILLEVQKRAASLYKSEETYFLVNGSTGGILSAVSACTERGGTILMARNCHKSVYNGVFLNGLKNIYTYPQKDNKQCVNCGLSVEDIRQILERDRKIQAVVITSPTYDGIVSNVKEIAKEVHKYKIPLIVDEAHGAHFGFNEYFPESSVKNEADIVIHSVHKTFPSLTQTAILHVNGELVDRDKLRKYLSIYQTSSPSYVLMASIDNCIRLINEDGDRLFKSYVKRLDFLRAKLKSLKNIELIDCDIIGNKNVYDFDRSKLILSVNNTNMTGKGLYMELNRYHLQMEMAADTYVIGITSIMDSDKGYKRLVNALYEIDNNIQQYDLNNSILNNGRSYSLGMAPRNSEALAEDYDINEKFCEIYEAEEYDSELIELEKSEGKVSAEYAYLYPPGIPIIVPGEIISPKFIESVRQYNENGLFLEGMSDYNNKKIKVIKM